MSRFKMTCIEPPAWASEPDVWMSEITLADYYRIQEHRTALLSFVHQEIEEYLNTPSLYVEEDEEGFPNRSCMTGEYYVYEESYSWIMGEPWFLIGIMCHCLGRIIKDSDISDYLGLEVWIRCNRGSLHLALKGVDSSVI